MSNEEDDPGPDGGGEPDATGTDAADQASSPAGSDAAPDEGAATDGATDDPAGEGGHGDGPGPDEQYCSSCGEIIKREAEICPECGVRNSGVGGSASAGSKDRVTAGVLAILLGWFGAHKFYLGDTGLGLLYLCFFWTGIPGLVGIIEGILYLTKTDEEFQRTYVD